MGNKKHVLLITPTCDTVVNFRKHLIKALITKGIKVSVIAFDGARKNEIQAFGVDFYYINDANRGVNPFKALTLKNRLAKLIKKIKPDVVFTFMLKPNIFGVPAAKKSGVEEIFSMVEGVGDVFINNSIKWKFIRAFVCSKYKKAFKVVKKVFFLNNDDSNEFVMRKLVDIDKCEQIFGIGVDLDYFKFKSLKNYNRFLMVARMLRTKGVIEYCKCARIVKQKYPDAQFDYLGAEGTIKVSDIKEYIDDGSINYLGTTKDVRPFLEKCAVYILPSYREGMSVSIMEAQAVGRAVITSNINGCRDAVVDNYNGFLCEVGDYNDLAQKAIWCLENPEKTAEIGKNSREFAQNNFDEKAINKKIIEILGW